MKLSKDLLSNVSHNDYIKIVDMLFNHFNYSINDINSFDELTPEELDIIKCKNYLGKEYKSSNGLFIPEILTKFQTTNVNIETSCLNKKLNEEELIHIISTLNRIGCIELYPIIPNFNEEFNQASNYLAIYYSQIDNRINIFTTDENIIREFTNKNYVIRTNTNDFINDAKIIYDLKVRK